MKLLAEKYNGLTIKDIPERYIDKRYGNNTGSYLLMVDDTKMLLNAANNCYLWVMQVDGLGDSLVKMTG